MMVLLLKFGFSSWEKTGLSPFLQSSGRSKGLSQREGEKLKITLYTYLHLNLPIFTYILFKVKCLAACAYLGIQIFIILPERNRIDHTNPQDRHAEMQSFQCFHEAYI